jgi:hypothetical protein
MVLFCPISTIAWGDPITAAVAATAKIRVVYQAPPSSRSSTISGWLAKFCTLRSSSPRLLSGTLGLVRIRSSDKTRLPGDDANPRRSGQIEFQKWRFELSAGLPQKIRLEPDREALPRSLSSAAATQTALGLKPYPLWPEQ